MVLNGSYLPSDYTSSSQTSSYHNDKTILKAAIGTNHDTLRTIVDGLTASGGTPLAPRLIAAGRMTPHGQRQIDAAKADGRWDAATPPIRATTRATVPRDLRAAIAANPRAQKTFLGLNKLGLFSLAVRTNEMKTPAGRARKIAELVKLLARGKLR